MAVCHSHLPPQATDNKLSNITSPYPEDELAFIVYYPTSTTNRFYFRPHEPNIRLVLPITSNQKIFFFFESPCSQHGLGYHNLLHFTQPDHSKWSSMPHTTTMAASTGWTMSSTNILRYYTNVYPLRKKYLRKKYYYSMTILNSTFTLATQLLLSLLLYCYLLQHHRSNDQH